VGLRTTSTSRPGPAFPAWGGPAERLRFFLRWAVLAPSRHNAQPWLFEIDGEELRLFVDPRRALRAADPHGREAVIACGAALENLRLAAVHHGHPLAIEPRAGGRGEPVAIVRLADRSAPTEVDEELFHSIPLRRTASALRTVPVPSAALCGLADEMRDDALVRRVPRWLARPVTELVAEADRIQWASARYRAELAAWTRAPARRPAADGIPAGRPSASAFLWRLLRSVGRRSAEAARRSDEQTRTLLLLSTRGDAPADWLSAGRAMQRLLLRAASRGIAAAFLSAAIEVPDVRRRLRRELGEAGMPQLLLRLGYGPEPRPTRRRPVELVLRSFSTEVTVAIELEAGKLSA
jgi:nitroreductase